MDFWDAFWLLAVFIPLTILWATCVFDLVFRRHDMSGVTRAAWILVIIIFPALGALAYVAFGKIEPQHFTEAQASGPRDEALRMTGRTPYP